MDICKTHHAAVKLVLHHSMARLKESFRIFETERISVTDMESESVQQLLISGDLLITDYSSVAFDFLYMNRPVIFFQFDRAYFQANHGAPFIDLDTELPGPVAMTASEVEHHMRLAIQRGWKIDEQSRPKIENFFAFRDNQNCSRIVDAIYARLANCPEATSSKSPASCSLVDS
jgi:CDP-glycerol glycerophosphotransferase (TagB/SpsB family)